MHQNSPLYSQACKVLQNSALFSALDENTRRDFILECSEIYWKKVNTIDHQIGMEKLYIIISGRLKVTQIDSSSGRSLALFLLKEGDIYDVFSLLDGEEHVVFSPYLCIGQENGWVSTRSSTGHSFRISVIG